MKRRSSVCRACKQPIVMLASMERENSWVAVDPSKDPEGTVRRHLVGPLNIPHAECLKGDALNQAHADGEWLWMLHRHTCPARKPANPRPAHVQIHFPNRTAGR